MKFGLFSVAKNKNSTANVAPPIFWPFVEEAKVTDASDGALAQPTFE